MINIEIDGIPLTVDPSKMIIQAADEAGIDIPRFCYHKKLSIAANCRMCLVEVEKANKALPACATPVSEGMKIFTASPVAKAAQRGVMEFLLINHPLDCPICDQGGECELQDLSMGYGGGVGRFSENKRVVKDKDIGALVKTDMTRCIHCTRCVRFGQEIAGIKELGATGRGEHMEIGTYIESSLGSELSGNIIDLCPVGALTSKPFRYKARAWELTAHPSIAPHDAVGSNIELHTRRDEVLRVVPRENESLNETWLSDRDRFSYLGLNHQQRATKPMIKQDGQWRETDWQTALEKAIDGIKDIKERHGADQIAGLISPTASLEESYLFQKLLRGIGTNNIDHRLRQQDFSDQFEHYQTKDWSLEKLDTTRAILLIGCNIRAEQPIIAHRVRQAALAGTSVSEINFFTSDLLMPTDKQLAVNIDGMLRHLSGIAKALIELADVEPEWHELLDEIVPTAVEQTIAIQFSNPQKATILVGALANNHPDAAKIRALAALIARLSSCDLIVLPTANSTASTLAGAVPFDVFDSKQDSLGFDAQQCWQHTLRSYILFGIEPELDCDNPALVRNALQQAGFIVSINSFVSDEMLSYSDVILPIASFAESAGTFVGVDGQWQSYTGAATAKGDSRPAWKVLRVLANLAKLSDFDYVSSLDVSAEVGDKINVQLNKASAAYCPDTLTTESGLTTVSEVAMYQCDSIVRRSEALSETEANQMTDVAKLNETLAQKYELMAAEQIIIRNGDNQVTLGLEIDNSVADDCIYMQIATQEASHFSAGFAEVTVEAVVEVANRA